MGVRELLRNQLFTWGLLFPEKHCKQEHFVATDTVSMCIIEVNNCLTSNLPAIWLSLKYSKFSIIYVYNKYCTLLYNNETPNLFEAPSNCSYSVLYVFKWKFNISAKSDYICNRKLNQHLLHFTANPSPPLTFGGGVRSTQGITWDSTSSLQSILLLFTQLRQNSSESFGKYLSLWRGC